MLKTGKITIAVLALFALLGICGGCSQNISQNDNASGTGITSSTDNSYIECLVTIISGEEQIGVNGDSVKQLGSDDSSGENEEKVVFEAKVLNPMNSAFSENEVIKIKASSPDGVKKMNSLTSLPSVNGTYVVKLKPDGAMYDLIEFSKSE